VAARRAGPRPERLAVLGAAGPEGAPLRRLALILALVGLLALPAGAGAHPLGNFSVNHVVRVRVDAGALRLHYILDQAEIPTFQERGLARSTVLARKRGEVRRELVATAGGRAVALRMAPGARLTHPPGQGGLRLTRLEVDLVGRIPARGAIRVRDGTFPGRVGWKAIVAVPGAGTAVRASVPREDPTRGLRAYPRSALQSPLDERSASFAVAPGSGTLEAPPSPFARSQTTANRAGDGLAGVFSRAAGGQGVLLFLLLAAFGWGALHALSPGHGKTMVAAYLVGARGTARHAFALGATVTISHTIGVFALGLVTLALSAYVLPEDLFPWLNLASGLLVVGIGGGVLRGRLRQWHRGRSHDHDHGHGHGHDS
jgi:nickel/cobalt exporter